MLRATMENRGGDSAENSVSGLGNRLKSMFEEQRFAELAELVGLEQIWYLYSPLTRAEAVALAERTFSGAGELELGLVRILRSETSDGISRGTYTCRLGWYEPDKVKQHELDFDIHIGFHVEGGVRLAYLGVTRADPFSPTPREPQAAATPPGAIPLVPGALPVGEAGATVMVYLPVLMPADAAQALFRGARQER